MDEREKGKTRFRASENYSVDKHIQDYLVSENGQVDEHEIINPYDDDYVISHEKEDDKKRDKEDDEDEEDDRPGEGDGEDEEYTPREEHERLKKVFIAVLSIMGIVTGGSVLAYLVSGQNKIDRSILSETSNINDRLMYVLEDMAMNNGYNKKIKEKADWLAQLEEAGLYNRPIRNIRNDQDYILNKLSIYENWKIRRDMMGNVMDAYKTNDYLK